MRGRSNKRVGFLNLTLIFFFRGEGALIVNRNLAGFCVIHTYIYKRRARQSAGARAHIHTHTPQRSIDDVGHQPLSPGT